MIRFFTLFLALAVIAPILPAADGPLRWDPSHQVLDMLASGNQKDAENHAASLLKQDLLNQDLTFLIGVLARSRFDTMTSASLFVRTMTLNRDSLQGQAATCALGMDLSKDLYSALYYYNALLILCRENPDSIPLHWLTGIMSRSLTKNNDLYHLGDETRTRIMLCGLREYEHTLSLMGTGPGPVMLHETMGNLLVDLQGYDFALKHHDLALQMERKPWSIHAKAWTLYCLNRCQEAIPLMQEAISTTPNEAVYQSSLGDMYWRLELKQEAIAAYSEACRLNPHNAGYLNTSAMSHANVGDYVSAQADEKKAISIEPSNRSYAIREARFAAINGEAGAPARVLTAGTFDFNGNPIKNEANSSPWFTALESGDYQQFHKLLPTVDINAGDPSDHNKTPLMHAACNGWDKIADDLIRAGANLDLIDDNKDTALHYSTQFAHPVVTKLLLNAGAKMDLQDRWHQTPFIMAAGHDWDSFKKLLEMNANINLATLHGGTALHYAVGHGDLRMMSALINKGSDVNLTNKKYGETPMMSACFEFPHPYVIDPLLSAGAKINNQDRDGSTALHLAVNPKLNIPLVELLLEKGADLSMKDKLGLTAISKARLMGFENIAVLMEKKLGYHEPFQFPSFPPPNPALPMEEQRGSYYVSPILLAQYNPLGRCSGTAIGDMKAAIKELDNMFSINNSSDLKEEIDSMKSFEPRFRDEAGNLPHLFTATSLSNPMNLFKGTLLSIHRSIDPNNQDETGWTQSHIIYLADLGITAGYLTPEEGASLISDASNKIRNQFGSWNEYLASFLIGANFHNGWEAERYGNICKLLIATCPTWPK
jgi:ankyrin repeat protein/tetratricopeptide (TPR) repeat protein